MNVGDTVEIDTGSAMETRKIASLGTAAGSSTTLWLPLPDGPVITIPAGSTRVPFTGGGRGGFGGGGGFAAEVGQKLGIGYGATYPAVANTVEKYEVVTVTEVGKPGTQSRLAAVAKAGDTSIRVRDTANISAGDKIILDIDSMDHGTETVTITNVGGAAGSGGGFGGRGGGGGTLQLAAPLKLNHSANLPFSVRGTGISFKPATAVAHYSGEPIQPLGTGITLDAPLANNHEINAAVHDATVTTAGYQGPPVPDLWFGGPVLGNMGSIVLRNAAALVVDSLNYGGVVDPWAAQGYQGMSPGSGNYVASPSAGRGGFGGRGGPAGPTPARSAGRFPDGADTGNNSRDFQIQTAMIMSLDSAAGANNIKVASVADFAAGQTITIDSGANRETAVIATVGTAGGTTVGTATDAGATVIPVASAQGFSAGQTITIDSGTNLETAVVASVTGGGRGGRGGFGGGRGGPGGASITVASPLTMAHGEGAQVSGSGITLTTALTKAHSSGAQVGSSGPTPGAPNQFARRGQ